MVGFRIDGSFEGLLSAVFEAYTTRVFPAAVLLPGETPDLTIGEVVEIESMRPKADRVFAGLSKRLTKRGRNTVLLAHLAGTPGSGTALFEYIRIMLDSPVSRENDLADPVIGAVDRLARKVYGESHLLQGFARFEKTAEGWYFAVVRPRHNVLSLLLPHFTDRFRTHRWMLYDAGREYGYAHEDGGIKEVFLDPALVADGGLAGHLLAEDEKDFQSMWKTYFAAATIRERINPRLQARCMPRHFWPYMTEVRDMFRAAKE